MANKAPEHSVQALAKVAKALGPLADEVVFIGGAVVGFLITDPAAAPIRTTLDVDIVINALSHGEYQDVNSRLLKLGFRNDSNRPMCSYYLGDLLIDVLPSYPPVLGFRGIWTKETLNHFTRYSILDNISIKIVEAPYFLALKLEAFVDRGKGDFYLHKDIEDIITLIAGRESLLSELISSQDGALIQFIKDQMSSMKQDLIDCVPAHLGGGQGDRMRAQMVSGRIENFSSI